MKSNYKLRQIAHIYLCMVPLIVVILAFTVGHVTPYVYVPAWIIHSFLMLFATWQLGVRYATRANEPDSKSAVAGVLFVLPWMLAAVFAGMGPPPFTINGWAELAGEQQFRFGILVVCGILLAAAFSLFSELARADREVFYSRLALTSILIAMPLFIVVMAFWGTVFTDTAGIIAKTNPQNRPEWLAPWRHMTDFLTTVEVCLFYIGTAMLAIAMKRLRWLSAKSCNTYFGLSLLAVAATLLPASVPEPLVILNYVTGIPAITMVMPYLIGLALLRRIGAKQDQREIYPE